MDNTLISKILRTLMFKKNIKTTQLARDLHLPQQTLQRIVSGASPNPHIKTLKPIADFFNISLEQLKGEQPLPHSLAEINLTANVKSEARVREIPIVKWAEIENYLNDPESYPSNDTVFGDVSSGAASFALTLNDSSMEPFFPEGALLILDPDKQIKDRCFALVKIAESDIIVFRQLLIDGEHQYLKPLNPDLSSFSMRILKPKDKIFAVMIEFRHRYDL